MSPRKSNIGGGRRAVPSSLNPGAESAVITLQDVADYLQCSYATAYRLAYEGRIPSFKLGGRWRVLKFQVDQWIAKVGERQ